MKLSLLVLSLSLLVVPMQKVKAEPQREFIMACTYGVLAGTLVGAATLAFTKKPGDNLQNIARGASLGLYAGILLGLYVTQVVPNQTEENTEEALIFPQAPKVVVYPVLGERGVEGAGVQVNVVSF